MGNRESQTSSRKIIALQRQQQALQMRLRGMTYQAIGDALGYTKKAAELSIKKAMQAYRDDIRQDTETLRTKSLARIEALRKQYWPQVFNEEQAPAPGKRRGKKPVDHKAADFLLKLEIREAQLLGLDVQPARLFGTGGGDNTAASHSVNLTGGLPERPPTPEELAPLAPEVPDPASSS